MGPKLLPKKDRWKQREEEVVVRVRAGPALHAGSPSAQLSPEVAISKPLLLSGGSYDRLPGPSPRRAQAHTPPFSHTCLGTLSPMQLSPLPHT